MVTQAQRENRALFNLERADAPLTWEQLRCASVNGAALRELRQRGHVLARTDEVLFPDTGEIQMLVTWEISPAGRSELRARIAAGIATTITHDERSHA